MPCAAARGVEREEEEEEEEGEEGEEGVQSGRAVGALGYAQVVVSQHGGGSAAAKGARTVTTGLLPHVSRWRGVGVTELETTV